MTRVLLTSAGTWCALLPVACASPAAHARQIGEPAPEFAEIGEPRPVVVQRETPASAMPSAARPDRPDAAPLNRVDRRISQVDSLLQEAHFRTALGVARSTLDLLETLAVHPQLGSRRAHLEVMAATAEVALARRAQARMSLMRALRADPTLRLDARRTSPKLLELLRDARNRTGIPEPGS